MANLILKTFIILGYLLARTKSTGHLYIKYEYFDTRGRDSGGDLCDYCFLCYNPCDPLLSMCLRFGHTSGTFTCSSSRIEYPQVHSGEYVDTDKVYFGSTIGGISNPVHYSTPNWFNGLFEISITANDEDGIFSGDDYIDLVIIRLPVSIRTTFSGVYTASGTRGFRPTTAAIRYKFYCDANYYGGACAVYCLARDDTSGHYTCHSQTGAKVCNTGYTGPDCDVGTCGTGYEWNVAQHACVDINECARGTSQCEQICSNNVGSYTCSCSSGYELYTSFHCRDINECTANPCSPGTCTNTVGSYQCACGVGYRASTTGVRRCNDIDECLENSDNCDHNCVNTPGSYSCGCRGGFESGSGGTCNDTDECTRNTDQCEQLCNNTMGSYLCYCTSGYYLSSPFNCTRVDFSLIMAGTVVSSTSIRLTWTTTFSPSQHPVSLSYQVWLRDITFSTSTQYTNHAQTSDSLQIDATGLNPYRRYQLYVRAVSGATNNNSNSITLQTDQDSPSAGPSHVEGLALNASQIRVYWSAPTRETQNGILTTYTILYTTSPQRQMNERGTEVTVSASVTSYTLTGLAAYTEYWLSVAASTSVGTGPYTTRSTAVRTSESAPTAAPLLALDTKTSTSITLTLQPPTDTASINGVISYYLVSFTGTNVDVNIRNLRVVPSTGNYLAPVNQLLSPLQEGVSYNIEASMHTSAGAGPLSTTLTISTQEAAPAGTPQNVQFTDVRTTSLSLSWDPPPLVHQNGVIRGYRLSYRGVSVDTVWRNSTLNTSHVALNSLEVGCQYTFSICAFTSVGDGPCIQATQSTLEVIPSGAPTMVTIENVASTSISISWSPPSPAQQNGVITGYNIVAIGQKHDNERFEVNVTGTSNIYQLIGLDVYERYSISIRARNSIGYGPTFEFNVTTSESAPDASPRNITGYSEQTSITISWLPIPSNHQNGQLIYYEVDYYTLISFIAHVHIRINVSNTQTQYTITGLEQNVDYIFKVRAYTSIGPGPYSPEITIRTQQSHPSSAPTNLQVLHLTHTQIQLTWDPPSPIHQNGPITQYQILLSQTASPTLTNTTYTTSQTTHTINSLHPYTQYDIRVRAENSVGAGPYTTSVTATTREAIPSAPPTHLTLISVTHSSANFSWTSPTPDSLNGPLQGYTLNVTNTQTATFFIETTTTAATSHAFLDSLTPNSRYSLVVAAVNSQGTGPHSSELLFSTLQSSPTEPPQISQITDNSPHSISLQWETIPAQSQNGPILSYTVNISTSEENRFISSLSVPHPTTTATFSNLHPFTPYTLVLTGSNAAGTSPPDYETHTTEEDRPTGAPTSLSATPSTTSITLSWLPPEPALQNGRIIQYTILFESSNYSTNMTQYVVTGLEEFTMFEWSVAAWTSIGRGPYTQIQSVSTLSSPPSEPPQNVTAIALSYQSIFVSWEPVPLSNQNGIILNYIVYFQRQDKKEEEIKQDVDASVTSTTLQSLRPFLSYTIYVVCENTEGSSPQSSTITAMTMEGSPSAAPTNFLITPTSPTTASASWIAIPPDQHNGILVYYEIVYQAHSLNTAVLTFRADANQTSAVLTGLHPAVEYTVYVRAFTQVGNGPDSHKLTILLPESVPNAAPTFISSVSKSNSIFLSWSPVNEIDRNGIIILYELRYSIDNTNSDEAQYTFLNLTTSTFNTTFTDLLPNTYLEFEIRAFTMAGPGPYSSKYFVSTKPHICTVCTNGNCVQGLNGYSCECNPGYVGETCSINVNDCIGDDCGHGSCKDGVNGYTCECDSGYKGQLCDILLSTPTCPQDVSLKFVWPDTLYGSTATLPCSDFDEELYGNAARECDSVGSWSLVDLSQCKRKLFDTLSDISLDSGMVDLIPDEIIEFSHDRLCNSSSLLYSGPPYTPGEMDILVTFINGLISDIQNENKTIRTDLIKKMMPSILCVLSNVLDVKSLEIFSLSNASQQAIALSDLIERIAKLNAQNYDTTSPNPSLFVQDNIQMFVAPLTDKQPATIPDYSLSAVKDTGLYPDSVHIPESEVSELFSKANGATPVIALVFSRFLGQALGTQSFTLHPISNISSRVITVQSSIGDPLDFTSPITLVFTLFPNDVSSLQSTCVYWDVETESWAESGLDLTLESDHVNCSSFHATSFAVLTNELSVINPSSQNEFDWRVGSAIGAILFIAIIIMCCILVICSCRLRQRRRKAYSEELSRRGSQDNNPTVTNPLYGHPDDTFNFSTRKRTKSPKRSFNSLESNSKDVYYYACTKIDPELDDKLEYDMANCSSPPDNSNHYSIINSGPNVDNPYSEIVPDNTLNPFTDLSDIEQIEVKPRMNYNPFEQVENNSLEKTSGDSTGIENPTYQSHSPPIGSNSAQPEGEQTEPIYSRISRAMECREDDIS